MTLPSPTPYVQWRRPGEEKWNDYDPWALPWDAETLEMRLLPRPPEAPAADLEVLTKIVADYDRRRSKRWGRFLLWLLRRTT